MHTDAVIGCDAIDAGPEWLRLKTVSGTVRTIPWLSVTAGGFPDAGQSISIDGVSDKAEPYMATHDALWIVYEGGVALAMIEKSRRDEMVAVFAQQLGEGWKGDHLISSDLMHIAIPSSFDQRPDPSAATARIMIALVAALLLFGLVLGYITSHL